MLSHSPHSGCKRTGNKAESWIKSCCAADSLYTETYKEEPFESQNKKKLSLLTKVGEHKPRLLRSIHKPHRPIDTDTSLNIPDSDPVSKQSLNSKHDIEPHITINPQHLIPAEKPNLKNPQRTLKSFENGRIGNPAAKQQREDKKHKVPLNAIKTSKINLNGVRKSSQDLVVMPQMDCPCNGLEVLEDGKSVESTGHPSQQEDSIYKSQVGESIKNDSINKVDSIVEQLSPIQQLRTPVMLRSAASFNGDSKQETKGSEVLLKFSAADHAIDLVPADLWCHQLSEEEHQLVLSQQESSQAGTLQQDTELCAEEFSKANIFSKMLKKVETFQDYFLRGGFIGGGKVSTVYKVQKTKTNFLVAAVEIHKKLAHSLQIRQKIDDNIISHYNLTGHPNVISLYTIFEDSTRCYFIQELAETNLRKMMQTKLSEEKIVGYLKGILSGLSHLHIKKIIHGNLKPENILVSLDTCKISDFGWKTYILQISGFTLDIGYCPPEYLDHPDRTQSADCWAVGVIAFEMITKELPNPRNHYKIKAISPPLQRLTEGLLQVDPLKRLTSLEALQILNTSLCPSPSSLEGAVELIL